MRGYKKSVKGKSLSMDFLARKTCVICCWIIFILQEKIEIGIVISLKKLLNSKRNIIFRASPKTPTLETASAKIKKIKDKIAAGGI